MPPATLAPPGQQPVGRGLGDDDEAQVLAHVLDGAVELVQQRRARRARTLRQRQLRGGTRRRSRAVVVAVAREHDDVDHERVAAGREELGHAHRPLRALEHVVLGDLAAGRQRAPRRRHASMARRSSTSCSSRRSRAARYSADSFGNAMLIAAAAAALAVAVLGLADRQERVGDDEDQHHAEDAPADAEERVAGIGGHQQGERGHQQDGRDGQADAPAAAHPDLPPPCGARRRRPWRRRGSPR